MDPLDETQTATELPRDPRLDRVVAPENGSKATPDEGALPLLEVSPDFYVVDREQGRGGIGVVFRARDRRLDRVVALKQLRQNSGAAIARFEREMRITARLQHPGVVPIHESGRFPSGDPFYAMKLVDGRSLKQIIGERKTLSERMQLLPRVLAVAETMAYAHSQGIIHRDLKPSNIILGSYGETIVIDWGLAKIIGDPDERFPVAGPYRDAEGAADLTVAGAVLGTPIYMPPEQARGERADPRSDVYAIGAVLYHVVAGLPPFEGASRDVLLQVVAARGLPARGDLDAAPADLLTIIRKATDAQPARRYLDGAALAADLRRFLEGRLVSAKRYSMYELFARWISRHRAVVSVGVVALVALAALAAMSFVRVAKERDRAEERRQQAEAQRLALSERNNDLLIAQARALVAQDPPVAFRRLRGYWARPTDGDEPEWLELEAMARGVAEWEQRRYGGSSPASVRALGDSGLVALLRSSAGEVSIVSTGEDPLSRDSRADTDVASVSAAVLSQDGRRLAFATSKSLVEGADVFVAMYPDYEPIVVLHDPRRLSALALSPNGDWLYAQHFEAGTAELWNIATATHRSSLPGDIDKPSPHHEGAGVYDVSRGLKLVGTDGRVSQIAEWDSPTVTFATDSNQRFFLASLLDGRVLLLDVESRRLREVRAASTSIALIAMSADGHRFVVASDRGLESFRIKDGLRATLAMWPRPPTALHLSSTGGEIALGFSDGAVEIWNVESRQRTARLNAHDSAIASVELSASGDELITSTTDGRTTRKWKVPAVYGRKWWTPSARPTGLVVTPELVHVSSAAGALDTLHSDGRLAQRAQEPTAIVSLRRGLQPGEVFTLSSTGDVARWDMSSEPRRELLLAAHGRVIGSSNEGTRFAAWSTAGEILMFSAGDAHPWRFRSRRPSLPEAVTLSEASASLLITSADAAPEVRDVSEDPADHRGNAVYLRTIPEFGSGVTAAAFSPDGLQAAFASSSGEAAYTVPYRDPDGQARGWRRELYTVTIGRHEGGATSVAFSADGQWVGSGGADGVVSILRPAGVLWPLSPGSGVQTAYHACRGRVESLATSPGPSPIFAVGCADGTVRLIDAAKKDRAVLLGHSGPVRHLAFSTGGEALFSADDTAVWRWNLGAVSWGSAFLEAQRKHWAEWYRLHPSQVRDLCRHLLSEDAWLRIQRKEWGEAVLSMDSVH